MAQKSKVKWKNPAKYPILLSENCEEVSLLLVHYLYSMDKNATINIIVSHNIENNIPFPMQI